MAEAEDVITDVARQATVFAQNFWRRHRSAPTLARPVQLADVAQRLDLLIAAVFGRSLTLRVAQPPAPPTWLGGMWQRHRLPAQRHAVPATDGNSIWLPASFDAGENAAAATERFRTMALQQAMRAVRGSALLGCPAHGPALLRDVYLLFEARAADDALTRLLPGLAQALHSLRQQAMQGRPPLAAFAVPHRPLEKLARAVLASPVGGSIDASGLPGIDSARLVLPATTADVLQQAQWVCGWLNAAPGPPAGGRQMLWRDGWTGELRAPSAAPAGTEARSNTDAGDADGKAPRSARLSRSPEVRQQVDDEDDSNPGVWMVQPAPPHEQAEDPMGLQRPTDRDTTTAAEDFADALSELPEARLVSAPGKPREVLLSDDPPATGAKRMLTASAGEAPQRVSYPEWDWQANCYRDPGATVLLQPARSGPQQWVDDTLEQRRGMLHDIRRRFELLRAQRVRLYKQLDGDDIDLQAYVESCADFRCGLPMAQRLYQNQRRSRRDMAIMLLVDISGSTDGWIAADKRVIDVEREALLLVCIALEGLAEPYSVLAFSGEGPHAVVVRSIKRFDECYDNTVAQRIAALEPEHYTRAGAAIRHASTLLMRQHSEHRLLLMLSDGKPNDIDDYEGRYGVEDMRQAITEARLQGIAPFCLTVDRQGASYLPAVFGPHGYALLQRPEMLPASLLEWLRRLVAG